MLRFLKDNPFIVLLVILMMAQNLMSGNMMQNPMDWFMNKLILLPAIIIGLSFHEFAHAKVAYMLGDDTPKNQGRVTINPAAHVDPIGFIALIFIGFGWGKPVAVNSYNFKNMRRDNLLVDLAGVTMNLLLAICFAGILKLLFTFNYQFMSTELGATLVEMLLAVISINLVLMVFNLLPIPPLDGFGIVTEIFDLRKKAIYYKIYDKGFVILMLLILLDVTGKILSPAVSFLYGTLLNIFF